MQHGHYSTLKLCVLEIRRDGGGMWESTEGPRDPLGPIMLSWQDNTELGSKSVSKSATTRCMGPSYLLPREKLPRPGWRNLRGP